MATQPVQFGLPVPAAPAPMISVGGVLPMMSASAVLESERRAAATRAQQTQTKPVITGLAGHIRSFWSKAKDARKDVEERMLAAMRARRGEYDAAKLQQIQQQNQPAIYMMLTSSKMRQVEALLRDVLLGTGSEKPWTMRPTPLPDLPTEYMQQLAEKVRAFVSQAVDSGLPVDVAALKEQVRAMRDQMYEQASEHARIMCERMERKMEDQLVEGGYLDALDEFIVDLATFPTAFLAGPIVRRKPRMQWGPNAELVVNQSLVLEWERVDPFDVYPAPWARNISEGPLIRRHRLTRDDLVNMIGVDGYDEGAIRAVLEQYGKDGHYEWIDLDTERAEVTGQESEEVTTGSGLIDALQYWGSASGRMLLDWGMSADKVPDPDKEYQIEAWLIGEYVIKAVLNADPLMRRPMYATSLKRVPGSVWGIGTYDMIRDCQDMCNGAARALAANLGIASGPQVAILSDRVPHDEEVTQMFPWKLWQFRSDPMGGGANPIQFFQPQSNAAELMTVYERFSQLADEYTGIPRYMAGFNSEGASRTASGMSMMIGNASKVIKQVIGNVDQHIIQPMLERLYYYNMRYGDDPDLKGDVHIVARGAMSLTAKEAAQVRLNEFLAATANPIDMQIVGLDGRAELLRQAVKRLDVNPDKVVPDVAIIKQRAMQAALAQMQQQQPQDKQPQGRGSREQLMNGAPVSDYFSPQPALS